MTTANIMSTTVTVLLTGGPRALSDAQRIVSVSSDADKVKLRFGRGYEHFADTGESTDDLRVFHWCDRTAIAE
jgi:uncharacterized protein DUF5988